ncbi:Ureidoglycolate lyase [Pigmentiphaga humi]|uniref:Ureidoglycolate lyase n=1 Tax=Pigmentiphaga humi TaxID=2478468 RepID=A0A3P4AZ24_9BURK|nr:fumarylacetoacetate hydrolase family protein [Pigmentiphaga humi]VCU68831.1 Ureidoglycolate lyase [Pigmentiphaga humi]
MSYRLLTYEIDGRPRAGLLTGDRIHDLAEATRRAEWSTVLGALQQWEQARHACREAAGRLAPTAGGLALDDAVLRAPILYPGTIYCAGANYTDHVAEMFAAQGLPMGPTMKELGDQPWHFIKTSRSAVVGPGAAVAIPNDTRWLDWEIELAAVIGQPAKNVSAAEALDHVAGFTIANDLSARDHMKRAAQDPMSPFYYDWIGQKCFDGACPIGPWIVPADDIGDPHELGMKLWVGDELMQDSNSNKLIFDIAEQIAALSARVTLQPGDLVLTGTPAGVGMGRKRFLQSGEQVRLWIEGIGELRHSIA